MFDTQYSNVVFKIANTMTIDPLRDCPGFNIGLNPKAQNQGMASSIKWK